LPSRGKPRFIVRTPSHQILALKLLARRKGVTLSEYVRGLGERSLAWGDGHPDIGWQSPTRTVFLRQSTI
jgi:hypothetical protein